MQQQGFTAYYPTIPGRRGRRGQLPEQPLFPRYLFARFDWADRHLILSIPGLSEWDGIVKCGDEPVSLSDQEIDQVRAIEARERMPKPKPRRGAPIEISVGRVRLAGQLAGTKRGQTVVVLRRAA